MVVNAACSKERAAATAGPPPGAWTVSCQAGSPYREVQAERMRQSTAPAARTTAPVPVAQLSSRRPTSRRLRPARHLTGSILQTIRLPHRQSPLEGHCAMIRHRHIFRTGIAVTKTTRTETDTFGSIRSRRTAIGARRRTVARAASGSAGKSSRRRWCGRWASSSAPPRK